MWVADLLLLGRGRMALPKPTAENYERLYPGTGVGEAQAQERMERKVFKAESRQLRRTGRNRGIVVPDCAYTRSLEERRAAQSNPEKE